MGIENVLVVSSNENGIALITDLLSASDTFSIQCAHSGSQARRMISNQDYDLLVINCPLSDEFGHDLGQYAMQAASSDVLLLVKGDLADDIQAKVENDGIFVVSKPVSRPFFYQAFKMVCASRRRVLGLKDENIRLQNKIQEIRLVDRAKYALMQYLQMTEPQAHRYIEKRAMDLRLTRKEVAQSILNTYET